MENSTDTNLFTEGAIYYYTNKSNTKKDYRNPKLNHDFMTNRPVYIVSHSDVPFDTFTVNVLPITSSKNRLGIPINITGYTDALILPYEIHAVHTENLTKYMGQSNEEIMTQVKDGLAYHLGFTEKKPEYMLKYETYLEKQLLWFESITTKKKIVYNFIQENCIFHSNTCVKYNELFEAYKEYANDNAYQRKQDFTKAINLIIFHDNKGIKFDKVANQFNGMTLMKSPTRINLKEQAKNGHASKMVIPSELEVTAKNESSMKLGDYGTDVVSDVVDYSVYKESDLLNLLSENGLKEWNRLDIVEKISFYGVNEKPYKGYGLTDADCLIIIALIKKELGAKKVDVFRLLSSGMSPMELSTINQYLLYSLTTKELSNNVKRRYLNNGGASKLKAKLYNNVKHYFKKIE